MQSVSRFFAEPLQESCIHDAKRGLVMRMTAVGFILLIASANVANLLLARVAGRRHEIALRVALGASTARILRQLLAESALLSLVSGVMGAALAVTSFGFLRHLIPENLSHSSSLNFNFSVLSFTILVSLASSFLFGLAPALQAARVDLNEVLREGARGSAGSAQRLGDVFVAGEVALSLVLLVCAELLLKSPWNLERVDLGFQSAQCRNQVVAMYLEREPMSVGNINQRLGDAPRALRRTKGILLFWNLFGDLQRVIADGAKTGRDLLAP